MYLREGEALELPEVGRLNECPEGGFCFGRTLRLEETMSLYSG